MKQSLQMLEKCHKFKRVAKPESGWVWWVGVSWIKNLYQIPGVNGREPGPGVLCFSFLAAFHSFDIVKRCLKQLGIRK